jgi:glycosyltransferase involved in cell wall biosynthesis
MKIAIVYPYYRGHEAPGHSLIYELARFLVSRGHRVSVVSGEGGYLAPETPVRPWYRRIVRRQEESGVEVIRTYSYLSRNRSYLGRLLGFATFALSSVLGLAAIGKPDLVLVSSPPLFSAFSACVYCRLRRLPLVVEIRDLWPASGVQMGLVDSRLAIAAMKWIERSLYDRAARIVALTRGIRDDICARGWPASKIEVVTCGVDFDLLYPDAEAGQMIRSRQGWRNSKVVLYFGAIGEANNIDVILRAAARLLGHDRIVFALVGDGIRRLDVERACHDRGLRNVAILPAVPKSMARAYLNAADLCVVTLKNLPLFEGALPTKLIDYLACGRPVLCGVRGEAAELVLEAAAGIVFDPDDDEALSHGVVELVEDPQRCADLGSNGCRWVRDRFSAQQQRLKMEQVLLSTGRSGAQSAAGGT